MALTGACGCQTASKPESRLLEPTSDTARARCVPADCRYCSCHLVPFEADSDVRAVELRTRNKGGSFAGASDISGSLFPLAFMLSAGLQRWDLEHENIPYCDGEIVDDEVHKSQWIIDHGQMT
jgi:hypothetical protein